MNRSQDVRVIATLMVVLLAMAACSERDPDSTVPTSVAPEAEGTERTLVGKPMEIAAELVEARAGTDRFLLPKQVALDLFASVYGDVPGAEDRFDDTRAGDGTLAVEALGAHWGNLSSEQRESVNAHLGLRGPRGIRRPPSQIGGDDPLVRAEELRDEFQARLGTAFDIDMVVSVVPASTWSGDTIADAAPIRNGEVVWMGTPDRCDIRISREFESNETVLAHEVFHCVQNWLQPLEVKALMPAWIKEGSAEWAAATVAGPDTTVSDHFRQWMHECCRDSLYHHDYEAVGYFWTIEAMGIDPWDDIPRMFASRTSGDGAHHPDLDLADLARQLSTRQFLTSSDAQSADPLWDLSMQAVPREFRTSSLVSSRQPFSASSHMGPFSKTSARQLNVDGHAVDIEITAEVGAVQEIGGELQLFEGQYSARICLEGGSHVVFIAAAFTRPGALDISMTVPEEDEGCEEDPQPCTVIPPPSLGGYSLAHSDSTDDECEGVYRFEGSRGTVWFDWGWYRIDPEVGDGYGQPGFDVEETECGESSPDTTCDAAVERWDNGAIAFLHEDIVCGPPDPPYWTPTHPGATSRYTVDIHGDAHYVVVPPTEDDDGWSLHLGVLGGAHESSDFCGEDPSPDARDISGESTTMRTALMSAARSFLRR